MIRPVSWFVLRLLGALIAGATIIFAAGAYRMSQGPLSLAFLTPYLQDAMSYGGTEFSVEVEDTVLTWAGWDRTLDVRTLGVKVRRRDGEVVLTAPEVSLGLSVRAMLEGHLSPTTIDIIGIKARLIREMDGKLDIGLGSEAESGQSASVLQFLLGELMRQPSSDGQTGVLNRISILNASFIVDDRPGNTVWRASGANLVLAKEKNGVSGELDFGLELDDRITEFKIDGRYDRLSDAVPLTIRFSELDPSSLALASPALVRLAGIDMEVAGSASLVVDHRTGRISHVAFDVAGGPGLIDIPDYYLDNLSVDEIAVRGALLDDFTTVHIDEMFVGVGGTKAEVRGVIALSEKGPRLDLEGGLRNLPINDLGRYWPPQLGPQAHTWVTRNIRGGTITEAQFKAAIPEGAIESGEIAPDAVEVDFKFEGLRVDYLHPMTRMTQTKGSARLTIDALDLKVESARVGALSVSEGDLLIEGIPKKTTTARIGLVVSGTAQDSLALANQEPLGLASRLDLDPSTVAGLAATRLKIELPLRRKISLDDVTVVAASNMDGASKPNLLSDYGLTDGKLLLRVDRERLSVEGAARIAGVPVNLQWREEFSPEGRFRSRYSLAGVLDDQARTALGLTLDQRVSGPIPFTAELGVEGDGTIAGQARGDLSGASLTLPELLWRKQAGTAGELVFDVEAKPDGEVTIRDFKFASGNFQASGQAEMVKGKFRRLDLNRLTYGANDISASIRPQSPDGYIIALEGQNFELGPHIDRFIAGEGSEAPPPLRLSARLARLGMAPGLFLTNVDADAVFDGERWSALSAKGKISNEADLAAELTTRSGRRLVNITSPDAAAVGRATGLFSNGVGGRLKLSAQVRDDLPDTPVQGELRIDDFRVVNAPVLARILTLGSLTGIGDLLQGEGITFTRTVVPFDWQTGNLSITDARAVGTMGITLEGDIDTANNVVKLEGTVVPAYTLNSMIGRIPLLGNLLVGKKGEGVFAVTYGVVGPIENPKVLVNPLSALAPGVLRNMFRFGGKGGQNDVAPGAPENER